jgi:hypothetical protein
MSHPLPPILNPHDPLRPYTPPPKPKKNHWAKVKKVLWASTLIFACLFSILIIVAGVMEDKIGGMVVKEVNKQLKTKLTVKEFSLSLISDFPNATAQLEGVFLNDAFGGHLVKARTVAFQVGFFSLFKDNIAIEAVVIKEGIVVLKTNAKGQNNYDIVKVSKAKTSKSVELLIEKAKLQDVRVIYQNAPNVVNFDLKIKNAFLNGNFGSKKFGVKSKGDLDVAYFQNGKDRYLQGKPLGIDGGITVDLVKNIYSFSNLGLNISSMPFSMRGLVQLVPNKGTFINIIAQNTKGNLTNLLQLLPPQYSAGFKDFKSTGDFTSNFTIKGLVTKTQTPEIQADVQFRNGRIESPFLKEALKNVAFKLNFNNKKSILDVQNGKASFMGNPFEVALKLTNLRDPSVFFTANGALPMGMAMGLIGNPNLKNGSGIIRCNDLKVVGKVSDFKNRNAFQRTQASGDLTLDNAVLNIKGENIAANGVLHFDNNQILVKNFNLKGLNSDATMTGECHNWLPVLLDDASNTQDLFFSARLVANKIDAGKIVALASPEKKPVAPQSYAYAAKGLPTPQYRKQFPILNRMKGRFESSVNLFVYDKIIGRNFKGNLELTGNDILLKGSAVAMSGGWDLDGRMDLGYRPHLETKLTTNKVNISEFFKECNNFGQSFMQNDNISGKVNARMVINGYWDEGFNFMKDKLHVLGDVSVDEGELKGVKMVEKFSAFIKIQDLKQIRFRNLSNQFEIYRQTIHIPTMFIQTNAVNLQISGEHSFNQDMDYNIVLNAGQVLMSRFKLFNPSLEAQPDKRNGLFNLYYNINGNISKNYAITANRTKVKAAFSDGDVRRSDVQNRLAQYFGGKAPPIIEKPTPYLDEETAETTQPPPSGKPQNIFNALLPSKKPSEKLDKKLKKEGETEYLPGF